MNMSGQNEKSQKPQRKLTVDKDLCPQDHRCPAMRVCPTGALVQESFALPSVLYDKCILCGKCVSFCPKKALKIAG